MSNSWSSYKLLYFNSATVLHYSHYAWVTCGHITVIPASTRILARAMTTPISSHYYYKGHDAFTSQQVPTIEEHYNACHCLLVDKADACKGRYRKQLRIGSWGIVNCPSGQSVFFGLYFNLGDFNDTCLLYNCKSGTGKRSLQLELK